MMFGVARAVACRIGALCRGDAHPGPECVVFPTPAPELEASASERPLVLTLAVAILVCSIVSATMSMAFVAARRKFELGYTRNTTREFERLKRQLAFKLVLCILRLGGKSDEDLAITDEYWEANRGYDRAYAYEMAAYLRRMSSYTRHMMMGERIDYLDLDQSSNAVIMLRHDEIVMHFWRDFADALERYDYPIESIELGGIEMPREVLDLLSPVLKAARMKGFMLAFSDRISQLRLAVSGRSRAEDRLIVQFVADIARSNTHLQSVGLGNCIIRSQHDMKLLCSSAANRGLYLGSCFDGNDLDMLRTVLDSSQGVAQLHILHSGIGSRGAALISKFLETNPPLAELDLDSNELDDASAKALAASLRTNTNLRQLRLDNNPKITEAGRHALFRALFNPSSLNACAESNHTCQVFGLAPDISGINDPHNGRRTKIYTVLTASDDGLIDMKNLSDVPHQLIPDVLDLAQTFSSETFSSGSDEHEENENVALTSVFDLVRGWAVSSLP